MTKTSAAAVKALRLQTGAGMMDCKTALQESEGDVEKAKDRLRAKGLARAAQKSGRAAVEGLIGLGLAGESAALVELNAETDFVARNALFQSAVRDIADIAAANAGDRQAVLDAPAPDGNGVVADMIARLAGQIGENIRLGNCVGLSVDGGDGVVAGYVHACVAEAMGRIGVIVAVEGDRQKSLEPARKIAMHVAATKPLAVSSDRLDADVVARERRILSEQAGQSGRPAEVIEKMIEGRMRKFFRETILLEQAFVMDPQQSVGEFAAAADIRIVDFAMLVVGEG